MRIVSGEFRGRHLHTPKGKAIRPTSDRVREALFNILASRVSGSRVLDLFAGTGALGLEALSRGAERAVFVDRSPEAVRLIQANIALCGVQGRTEVIAGDIVPSLERLIRRGHTFHLVFMDPPYGLELVEKTLSRLGGVVEPEGLVVTEHSVRDVPPDRFPPWQKVQHRKYGDTMVSFFERVDSC